MAYYRTCPDCGSNSGPGEECGCKKEPATAATAADSKVKKIFPTIVYHQNNAESRSV